MNGRTCVDLVTLLLLSCLLVCVVARPDRTNLDSAQYLQCGQRLLLGEIPYVDMYDTNPPLIMYVSVIPALFSELLDLPIILVSNLCVFGLLLWSTWTCRSLLLLAAEDLGAVLPRVLSVAYLATSCLFLQHIVYGQREHLLLLLVTPFLFLRALRWMGSLEPRERVWRGTGLGLIAGVGLCLKPQFALVLVLTEGYQLLSRRRLAPLVSGDLLGVLIAVLGYGAYFAWFMSPAARDNLLNHIVPMVVHGYPAYNKRMSALIISWRTFSYAMAVLIPTVIRPADSPRYWVLVRQLQLATLGALLAYLQQHKGFGYHLLPTASWSVLALTAVGCYLPACSPFNGNQSGPILRFGPALTGGLLVVLVTLCMVRDTFATDKDSVLERTEIGRTIASYSQPGDRVLVLSTSVGDPPFPTLLQAQRFQATRYMCAWPVPGFYRHVRKLPNGTFPYHPPPTASEAERRFLRETAQDIRRYHPPLILIHSEGWHQGCSEGFSLLDYFRQAGLIDEAMRDYTEQGTVSEFSIFVAANPSPAVAAVAASRE